MKLEDIEFEVQKISPKPGDIIILKADKPFEPEWTTAVAQRLRETLPEGVTGCLIGPGFDMMLESAPTKEAAPSPQS